MPFKQRNQTKPNHEYFYVYVCDCAFIYVFVYVSKCACVCTCSWVWACFRVHMCVGGCFINDMYRIEICPDVRACALAHIHMQFKAYESCWYFESVTRVSRVCRLITPHSLYICICASVRVEGNFFFFFFLCFDCIQLWVKFRWELALLLTHPAKRERRK